jgi:ATP-dependent helicase YprA (DUF1998 family)
MTSAVRVYSQIVESTIQYLNTAYLTKYDDFNSARDALVSDIANGPMFREPLYEIQDRYPLSGETVDSFLASSGAIPGIRNVEERSLVASLFSRVVGGELYVHQIEALRGALLEGQNVVVTTGTGSGKTLSFLLPMLLTILREALGEPGRPRWKGANLTNEPWWRRSPLTFHPKRQPGGRSPAIRALLMYPLNALVQDQVENLRKVVDSIEADIAFDRLFSGDRIYVGQYNGETPGRGLQNNPNSLRVCAAKLRTLESDFGDVTDDVRHRLSRPFGSELLTR